MRARVDSMGYHALVLFLGGNPFHNPEISLNAPVNAKHGRGNRQAGSMAFATVKVPIQYYPSRQCKTSDSWVTVSSHNKQYGQNTIGWWGLCPYDMPSLFACVPLTKMMAFDFMKERKRPFRPIIPEVCRMADATDTQKTVVPQLSELITERVHQCGLPHCHCAGRESEHIS